MIKDDNKRIAITLTEKEVEQIEKLASKRGVTKSVILKLAIAEFIAQNKQKK